MGAGILTVFDLLGIQSYIFNSNLLRENLGGSWLVREALEIHLPSVLGEDAKSRIIFSGGGNALVISPDESSARGIATELSRRLMHTSPGLELACAHQAWDGNDSSFRPARRAVLEKLARAKTARWPSPAFDGLGVTEVCATTGEPAIGSIIDHNRERWLGPSARARIDASVHATQDLTTRFPRSTRLEYTEDLDRLGTTRGERSLLGIVHFDGNQMGKRFEEFGVTSPALHELSSAVERCATETLRSTLDWVERLLPIASREEYGGLTLDGAFPVRPIVFGGDDITLVCEGRLALDIAARLLDAWHNQSKIDLAAFGGEAHACAGVALVRYHYPFFRAYQLAAESCRYAKRVLRKRRIRASLLDWVLVSGGGLGRRADLDEMSAADDSLLSARPYYVCGQPSQTESFRSWKWLRENVIGAWQDEEDFRTQRKSLGSALRQGRQAGRDLVDQWRQRFGETLPDAPGCVHDGGFFASDRTWATPFCDALELMDRCLPWAALEEVDKVAVA